MSSVAIVIPVKDEENRILEAIESIALHNNVKTKFYVVDDNSSDSTVENVKKLFLEKSIDGEVICNSEPSGAGRCRNQGFEKVKEDYVLFFDADDYAYPSKLDYVVAVAERNGSQVTVMAYDRVHGPSDTKLGMNAHDQRIFDRLKVVGLEQPVNVRSVGYALELVNYPWNKLVRTDYAREISLRFSETPVHNDVFAHWQIMMNAENISFIDEKFCGHRVAIGADQITNISDSRRMSMLSVFDELHTYFSENSFLKKRFYHFFISFKIKLFRWGHARIDDEHEEEFLEQFRLTFKSMTKKDYYLIFEKMPNVAIEALKYRLDLN
uniref:glycosyltransferase family 2 protein n=1 Tax=Halomonas sp. TaxID=1486246 RepID=UPI002639BF4E|nr:glycosyltransferase family A protein [Halomonas sp.]